MQQTHKIIFLFLIMVLKYHVSDVFFNELSVKRILKSSLEMTLLSNNEYSICPDDNILVQVKTVADASH